MDDELAEYVAHHDILGLYPVSSERSGISDADNIVGADYKVRYFHVEIFLYETVANGVQVHGIR